MVKCIILVVTRVYRVVGDDHFFVFCWTRFLDFHHKCILLISTFIKTGLFRFSKSSIVCFFSTLNMHNASEDL